MKKLILLLLFLPFLGLSQTSSITSLANFSEADSNRAHVSVSGKAFELMSKIEADSIFDEQLKKLASSIKGMDGYMGFTPSTAMQLVTNLENSKAFEKYAEFSQKDNFLRFYIAEVDGVVSEMILIAYDKKEGYAGSVYGEMDIRDVGKLYKLVNMKGFDYLENHEKK